MPPEFMERLHGAIRSLRPARGADSPAELPPERPPWWDPGADSSVDPDTDSVLVGDTPVARGSHVLLRPGRSSDAQDRFLAGMRATVQAVVHDVDGGVHVAGQRGRRPGRGAAARARPVPLLPARGARGRMSGYATPRRAPKVLVAGVGNVFLADDGFGVEVVRRLRERDALPAGVELVDTGIRGIHLAYQLLDGYDVLVIVDAISRGEPPGTLYTLEHDLDARPADVPPVDGHGMDPAAVLDLLDGLAGSMGVDRPVGRVLVVGCEPALLDEQIGLTPPVAAAV